VDNEAHNEFESEGPGYCGAQDTYLRPTCLVSATEYEWHRDAGWTPFARVHRCPVTQTGRARRRRLRVIGRFTCRAYPLA
jgi:hypothetical protein